MRSPFPGMDPYLEDPARWPGVHNLLITYVWEAVMSVLPSGYNAAVEQRCYVVGAIGEFIPDITVHPGIRVTAETNTSVLTPDEPLLFRAGPVEVRENYVNIVRSSDGARVITAIEILSPSNKRVRTAGRRAYLKKQQETLRSRTHLVETDLLRAGDHTIALPSQMLRHAPRWDYLACLTRSIPDGKSVRREFAVWPRTIRERLPVVSVPLDRGDPDIVLDVQAVIDKYYEVGRLAEHTDYSMEPYPPLEEPDRQWAEALLREKGVRR
ncbi:MAG TPA: DUF4058 family protein [Chthonomonadaceae bacterium]|nr:DUF4058 family protein [Chthonomonadaceae bacterium]